MVSSHEAHAPPDPRTRRSRIAIDAHEQGDREERAQIGMESRFEPEDDVADLLKVSGAAIMSVESRNAADYAVIACKKKMACMSTPA